MASLAVFSYKIMIKQSIFVVFCNCFITVYQELVRDIQLGVASSIEAFNHYIVDGKLVDVLKEYGQEAWENFQQETAALYNNFINSPLGQWAAENIVDPIRNGEFISNLVDLSVKGFNAVVDFVDNNILTSDLLGNIISIPVNIVMGVVDFALETVQDFRENPLDTILDLANPYQIVKDIGRNVLEEFNPELAQQVESIVDIRDNVLSTADGLMSGDIDETLEALNTNPNDLGVGEFDLGTPETTIDPETGEVTTDETLSDGTQVSTTQEESSRCCSRPGCCPCSGSASCVPTGRRSPEGKTRDQRAKGCSQGIL